MKKIIVFSIFVLIGGIMFTSCGGGSGKCSNNGDCKWTPRTPAGTGADNQSGGYCNNTPYGSGGSHCVVFDSNKGIEASNQQKTIPCNCS